MHRIDDTIHSHLIPSSCVSRPQRVQLSVAGGLSKYDYTVRYCPDQVLWIWQTWVVWFAMVCHGLPLPPFKIFYTRKSSDVIRQNLGPRGVMVLCDSILRCSSQKYRHACLIGVSAGLTDREPHEALQCKGRAEQQVVPCWGGVKQKAMNIRCLKLKERRVRLS